MNNPEDNQWGIKDLEQEIRVRLVYAFTNEIEDKEGLERSVNSIHHLIQSLLSQQAEKQREEILAEVDEDHDIAYQAGRVDGYNEAKKDLTNNKE